MIKNFNGKCPSIADTAFISEMALIIGDVRIGQHSGVWPGAVIRGDFALISIGDQTIIEDNVVVHTGADMYIGDNVIVGHGAVLHGKAIGNNSLIANNATVLDDSVIGNFCIVGAGCVISPGMIIPDRSLVFGVPGKIAGEVKQHQIERLKRGNESYREMFDQYRKDGI